MEFGTANALTDCSEKEVLHRDKTVDMRPQDGNLEVARTITSTNKTGVSPQMSTPRPNVVDPVDQINTILHPTVTSKAPERLSHLDILAGKLINLKVERTLLNNEIKQLEKSIILETGNKPEGVANFNLSKFKIATTGKIDRKITDLDSLVALASELVVTKHSIDMQAFKALAISNPSKMQRVLLCIESKVARTAVSVTPIEA